MKKNRLLIMPILLLGAYFIIRLLDQSKMIFQFPLDTTNDFTSYIGQLFFLKTCGFLQSCPYWYNGFITFKALLPGWFIFTFPIYFILKNILLTTYISLILLFFIGLIAILLIGKKEGLAIKESLLLFLLTFANPIAVGNFIRLGRIMELFSFISFLCFFAFLLYYKKRNLDLKFLWIIPIYIALITSHVMPAILGNIILLGFILIHLNKKDIFYIITTILVSLGIISIWLINFLKEIINTSSLSINNISIYLNFKEFLLPYSILLVVTSLMIIFFLIYFKNEKKLNLKLYGLIILLGILILTRLIVYVPIFNLIYIDTYIIFFMFFLSFFFLKTKILKNNFMVHGLIVLSLIFIITSSVLTPWFFENTKADEEAKLLLNEINGPFVMKSYVDNEINSYSRAYYSYAAIYNNLTTPWGWAPGTVSKEVKEREYTFHYAINDKDCKKIKQVLEEINSPYVIAFKEDCNTLNLCGLKKIDKKEYSCLYTN